VYVVPKYQFVSVVLVVRRMFLCRFHVVISSCLFDDLGFFLSVVITRLLLHYGHLLMMFFYDEVLRHLTASQRGRRTARVARLPKSFTTGTCWFVFAEILRRE